MALFRRKQVEDQSVEETVKQEEAVSPTDGLLETKIHFSEHWEMALKERYIYQYHHRKLAKIKEGQLSIAGIGFYEVNGEIAVEALIQNAVSRPITIHAVDLLLMDEEGNLAARKRFSLEHLGELPAFTTTPWRFLFFAEDRVTDAPVSNQWKIMFELNTASNNETLDLELGWEERLSGEKRLQMESMLARLPKLGANEVNIAGVEVKFLDNQSLEAVLLIRNGTSQELQLKQLPLVVEDAAGDIVCKGTFELPPLLIKPQSAKPWAFVFPASLIAKQDPDFSTWRVAVAQN
ncbi:accessory Sec system S-layer assembly protein [Bacillus sp. BRMEA1]|uniref:accessory Sec system S-layer assembly protein n=1 Tax=Neobacillus endophyticus TaxID=2738405 RepID=UPI0015636ECC|nr:accessory Sec system S-layer assembly protein [Neobacillus endophyticus]NRD77326.1 accessory Sec system S-layer assembly protein [Neobacillus endophyticus]